MLVAYQTGAARCAKTTRGVLGVGNTEVHMFNKTGNMLVVWSPVAASPITDIGIQDADYQGVCRNR